jgi:MFS family permease
VTCTEAIQASPAPGRFGSETLPFIVGVGTMFVSAHVSGINVVFPQILAELGVSVTKGPWILTAYTLSLSACLLVFGNLADRIGPLRIYTWGMALFGLSSGLCALASGEWALVLLRVLQGVGAAMISATSVSLIGESIARSRLGRAVGWQTGMTYAGLALGPLLAGFAAQRFGWRVVFGMNVPAAALAIFLSRGVPEMARQVNSSVWPGFRRHVRLAPLWISGVVVCFVVWNGTTISYFASAWAAICLFFFLRIEARSRDPFFGEWVFSTREFVGAATGEAIYYMCLYAVGFLLTIYLVRGRGFAPAQIGVLIGAQSAIRAVLAPVSGCLSDRFGTSLPVLLGIVFLAGGLCGLCLLTNESAPATILMCLILLGAGAGLFAPANSKIMLCSAPVGKQGMATGILAITRNAGMTLGVGLAALLYARFGGDNTGSLNAVRETFAVVAGIAILQGAFCLSWGFGCARGGSPSATTKNKKGV